MTSPLTVYKLIILYMLDRTGAPISNAAITDFILESGVSNSYISVQRSLSEMEESGLIGQESAGNRTMIRLTEDGKEALKFFGSDLNADLKEECTAFLRSHGMEIRTEAETAARYQKRITGVYEVNLSVSEMGMPLIDLKLTVPDEELARQMTENWPVRSQTVYQKIMDALVSAGDGRKNTENGEST